MAVIEVKDLVKKFPLKDKRVTHAISGISFSIEEGETLSLVGESGSGKTTTGRCVLRLIEPTSGSIIFEKTDITKLKQRELRPMRPKMQMVFQETLESLNPAKRIDEIIMEPFILWDSDRATHKDRVKDLMSLVGLSEKFSDLYPHQLTGGQQQRAGIARAIALNPRFLVLDEPTSRLDPTTHAEIMNMLKRLQEEFKFAYLFISHDLTAVEHISHMVAIMYLSRIVEIGSKEDIFKNPQHPYTRALLSSALFPDPDVKQKVFILEGEIPSAIDLPKGCYFTSRCPVAIKGECDKAFPAFVEVGERHKVACINLEGASKFFNGS